MPSRLVATFAAVLALSALEAFAQPPGTSWYARVWEVDGQTVLALGATWGQEIRSGPGGPRHGLRVPLTVEDGGDTVRFEVASGLDHATRWIVRRHGREVVIERWVRSGPDGTPWERAQTVRHPL